MLAGEAISEKVVDQYEDIVCVLEAFDQQWAVITTVKKMSIC